ncbi:aldehyde dehydrogenase family protein [Auritidibacter ignavus]|uniref:aldehyde dehydrogenase family protein n=1 Tax=Auritidibacter ignavus TaxID=678932 RepID=UPI00244B772E|nr:aldehyde dehydrogenase family protein [Auritidibacter ignavus]WGH85488.1 aldehyde dehydrogenase family protein [Auritidibacter ignavus]WGH87774.1 aldehyde dehydrogenase family protein [Auritidibacter ignavus]
MGRIVYEAAAQQLTPVTLELGGKSPAVVSDGPVGTIAKRLAWGKFVNAGQTCVAPDYVLAVGDQMRDKLEAELPKVIDEFYESSPESSLDYGRLISAEHTQRLVEMLQQTLDAGAELNRAEVSKTDQLDTLKAVYPPYGWAKKQFTKRVL